MEGQAGVGVVTASDCQHLPAEGVPARPWPWLLLLFPLHCAVMVEAENELLHWERSNLDVLVAVSHSGLWKWARVAKTRVVDSLLMCGLRVT